MDLLVVETDLMFRDNYLILGCRDKPEDGVSGQDNNSRNPGGLVLLLITLMTYWHSHNTSVLKCVVNAVSHFKSLQCT